MSDMDKTQEAELMDHNYDGIQEYDNPIPNWWMITFLGTIIFAFIYWIHYEFGGGPSMKTELAAAMATIDAQKASAPKVVLSETDIEEKLKDQGLVTEEIVASYKTMCAACHGNDLQGMIGPNLTDAFWMHGKGIGKDIIQAIKEGVPEKGMPPWGPVLSDDQIMALTAYILSKQDSNPAGAKPPQGDKVR